MARVYPHPVSPVPPMEDAHLQTWLHRLTSVEDVNYVQASEFQNSWTNDTTGTSPDYLNAGYYKDPWGRVYLQGRVTGGTSGTTVFTLPEGYRPSGILLFRVVDSGASADCQIDPDGDVTITTSRTPEEGSLDGINFRAASN